MGRDYIIGRERIGEVLDDPEILPKTVAFNSLNGILSPEDHSGVSVEPFQLPKRDSEDINAKLTKMADFQLPFRDS